jgi:hypothetical protein
VASAKRTSQSTRSPARAKSDSGQADDDRAQQLLKAIGFSEDVIRASETLSSAQKRIMLDGLEKMRTLVSNPEAAFKNVRSLAYLEQAVVQPWNEQKGPEAEAFWTRVRAAGLDYQQGKTLREPRSRK